MTFANFPELGRALFESIQIILLVTRFSAKNNLRICFERKFVYTLYIFTYSSCLVLGV